MIKADNPPEAIAVNGGIFVLPEVMRTVACESTAVFPTAASVIVPVHRKFDLTSCLLYVTGWPGDTYRHNGHTYHYIRHIADMLEAVDEELKDKAVLQRVDAVVESIGTEPLLAVAGVPYVRFSAIRTMLAATPNSVTATDSAESLRKVLNRMETTRALKSITVISPKVSHKYLGAWYVDVQFVYGVIKITDRMRDANLATKHMAALAMIETHFTT